MVSLILAFTPAGFPYSSSKHAPRLQRFRILHARRTLFDPSNSIVYSNGSAIIYAWERNAFKTIDSTFGETGTRDLSNDPLCEQLTHCGYPHYPLDRVAVMAHFYAMPNIQPTVFNLVRAQRSGTRVEVEFTLLLVTLTDFSISPEAGMELVEEESIKANKVTEKGKVHYFGSIVNGLQTGVPFRVNFVLEVMKPSTSFYQIFTILTLRAFPTTRTSSQQLE